MNQHDSDDDQPRLVPAAPVDASLDASGQGWAGRAADAADAQFPDTAEGPQLVLFQRADGAIELRWRLDLAALEHAWAAFGHDGGPHARLLLKALADGGRLIAQTRLTDAELLGKDTALYDAARVEGPLQAEMGLGDAAGGWMLIARSNRLDASGPVGAELLRDADETLPAQHPEMPEGETDTAAPDFGAELAGPAAPAPRGRRQEAPSGLDARPEVMSGSGPISPPDPDQGVELQAELVLSGRAPPGQVVELGGHDYRVGDGGRFVLRIPVSDRELIQAALAQLARLPVAHRDAD